MSVPPLRTLLTACSFGCLCGSRATLMIWYWRVVMFSIYCQMIFLLEIVMNVLCVLLCPICSLVMFVLLWLFWIQRAIRGTSISKVILCLLIILLGVFWMSCRQSIHLVSQLLRRHNFCHLCLLPLFILLCLML